MDELTAALATSFSVSGELNTTSAEHPRFSQYKMKLSPTQRQEARRKKILDVQKKSRESGSCPDVPLPNTADLDLDLSQEEAGRRFDFATHARKLTDDSWNEEEQPPSEEPVEEDMEIQTSLRRPGRYYKDQLMYSEWLVEVPADFETEWLMVVCPTAKRRLVVASRGQTISYNKGGYRCMNFPSFLPGGNRSQGMRGTYSESTILDCLFCEKTKTYYVLDLMFWKNMPIYDSETEFRFYWMHEKFQEVPLLSTTRKTNPCRFVPLPSFPCTAAAISNAIQCASFDIDGLLFYHKRTHYTFGATPLVVWLKTYMVPDVLKLSVPYKETSKAPPSYTNYANHLDSVKGSSYGSPPEKTKPRRQQGKGGKAKSNGEPKMIVEDTSEKKAATETQPFLNGKGSESLKMPETFNFGSPTSFSSADSVNGNSSAQNETVQNLTAQNEAVASMESEEAAASTTSDGQAAESPES